MWPGAMVRERISTDWADAAVLRPTTRAAAIRPVFTIRIRTSSGEYCVGGPTCVPSGRSSVTVNCVRSIGHESTPVSAGEDESGLLRGADGLGHAAHGRRDR